MFRSCQFNLTHSIGYRAYPVVSAEDFLDRGKRILKKGICLASNDRSGTDGVRRN
jgi:hypothetical protein